MSFRALRHATRATTNLPARRTFAVSARAMADGDAGSPRSGGAAQGDAFTKREQASEDYYVREQEKQKLAELKKKIADSEAQLAKDRKQAEEMAKKH